jgi:hypothetical protein
VEELVAVLARERHALDVLLFRLLEARCLLSLGDTRFLHLAAEDVEAAAEDVREAELRRALLPSLGGDGTLVALVGRSDEPLRGILDDHRVALARLAVEIGAVMEAVEDGCEAGLERIRRREPLAAAITHRPWHSPVQPRAAASTGSLDDLDREILVAGYESLRLASTRLSLPSLEAFLG